MLDGRATTFAYDAGGQVVRYDAASGDDVFVEWDGRGGLPARITVGASKTDPAPTARDAFRYGPSGERYLRRTAWRETVDGAERTRSAEILRAGATERVAGDAFAAHPWVEKTRIGPVLAVRTSATSTPAFEYVHADHLGSPAAVTDAAGAELLALAHDPYGARRRADWTARLPAAEARALAAGQDAGRTRAGFTGHETLDRTGFVHMNGRLYDPRLGRFLSPDPVVSEPWSGQGWNPYSYVGNSPMSRTDPTGYCYHQSMPCAGQGGGLPGGGGGGFTPWAATLWTQGLSFHLPFSISVQWGQRVSVSVGGLSLGVDDSDDDGGSFEDAVTFSDGWIVTLQVGPPDVVWTLSPTTLSPGNQESGPADAPLGKLVDMLRRWLNRHFERKYKELRDNCERIHGAGGCDGTSVKEVAEVFSDATVMLGAGVAGGPLVRNAAGLPRALRAPAEVRVVIGRTKDLQNLPSNERSLLGRLPNQYNDKLNWRQNSGVLRQEMRRNRPIRDASPGDKRGVFLNAERQLLRERGWKFDTTTNLWMPPGS